MTAVIWRTGANIHLLEIGCCGKTADPSTSLRSGRDDKKRVVTYLGRCHWDVWIPGGDSSDFPAIRDRDKAQTRFWWQTGSDTWEQRAGHSDMPMPDKKVSVSGERAHPARGQG